MQIKVRVVLYYTFRALFFKLAKFFRIFVGMK